MTASRVSAGTRANPRKASAVVEKLKHLPDKLLPRLVAPAGTNHFPLHRSASKTFHLGTSSRKLNSDGTLAIQKGGRTVCFSLQAEDTTDANVSSLMGKSVLALLCTDSGQAVSVEGVRSPAPRTGKRGAPQKNLQPVTTPVDELHVLFLALEGRRVHGVIADLKRFFAELKDSRIEGHLHAIVVDPKDVDGALRGVQEKIDAICAAMS